jgi:hypothetical protein
VQRNLTEEACVVGAPVDEAGKRIGGGLGNARLKRRAVLSGAAGPVKPSAATARGRSSMVEQELPKLESSEHIQLLSCKPLIKNPQRNQSRAIRP